MANAFKDNKALVPAVLSVNGVKPDSTGNVAVSGDTDAVKTVNGVFPDNSGNVKIDTGVMKVNGTAPDGSGNVTIPIPSGVEPRVTYDGTPPYEIEMQPNTLYYLGTSAIQLLTITLAAPQKTDEVAEYHIIFKSGSTATILNLPSTVIKPTDFAIQTNKMYELSICENLLVAAVWEV